VLILTKFTSRILEGLMVRWGFVEPREEVGCGCVVERARPLISLEKLVASKFLGYETKPNGATEHQTDRGLRRPFGFFVAITPKARKF
jgi:hypothetical protein